MTSGSHGDQWPLAAAPARLAPLDVDVWSVPLDGPAALLTRLESVLSSHERERADRFHFDRDRRRFVCARGVLRSLIGEYLSVSPRDLAFSYGEHGKPALSGPHGGALTFNVSHSHELALIAIARDVELGVDVEAVRPMQDADDIASRFFSAREVVSLRALPAATRDTAFFTCWTRKEAYLKALGSGLALPLDGFDVTFAPGEPATLVVRGDEAEAERWSIRELAPGPGYEGALVVEKRAGGTRCWQWTEARAESGARSTVRMREAV